MLDREFASNRIEYLLLDLHSRQRIAMRWSHPETAIPVGSLLKPFVALAYAQQDSNRSASGTSMRREFPTIRCTGKSDGCWRTGGHGSLKLEQAVAVSCNAYFLALARELAASDAGTNASSATGTEALRRVAASYGLPSPPTPIPNTEQTLPRSWIGATSEWRIAPEALAQAYVSLAMQANDEVVHRLLDGMRQAAGAQGTAAKLGTHPGGALAKTGTAPCVADDEPCIASGDGLVVVLTPAENPTLLLMVRERGTTGAIAAEAAGKMLSRMESGREK